MKVRGAYGLVISVTLVCFPGCAACQQLLEWKCNTISSVCGSVCDGMRNCVGSCFRQSDSTWATPAPAPILAPQQSVAPPAVYAPAPSAPAYVSPMPTPYGGCGTSGCAVPPGGDVVFPIQ